MLEWMFGIAVLVILLVKLLDYLDLFDLADFVGAVLRLATGAAALLGSFLIWTARWIARAPRQPASTDTPPRRGRIETRAMARRSRTDVPGS
jgi:hypothetical protein